MTRTFSFAFKTLVVHIFCVCSGSYLCMYGNVHMYIDEKLLLLNELVIDSFRSFFAASVWAPYTDKVSLIHGSLSYSYCHFL